MKKNRIKANKIFTAIIYIIIINTTYSQFPPGDTMAVEKWSEPKIIWSIFNFNNAIYPCISWDGKTLYFTRGLTYGTIFKVVKNDTGWSNPIMLSNNINYLEYKVNAKISPNGKILYINAGLYPRIYRSYWDSINGDWGVASIFYDNGININNPPWGNHWQVSNFFNDTTMILLVDHEAHISRFNTATGLWSSPVSFPDEIGRFFDMDGLGGWAAVDSSRYYVAIFSYVDNSVELYVNYNKPDSLPVWPRKLNLSYESAIWYRKAKYKGHLERNPYFSPDGKTMYFTADYHKEKRWAVYYSRMVVNEKGDTVLTSLEKPKLIPNRTKLYPVYPNPFNPVTTINYQIGERTEAVLRVYDILGKEVDLIMKEEKEAGEYKITYNGTTLGSGVYFLNLKTNTNSLTTKLLLIK